MGKLLKVVGWVALAALVWGVLTDPDKTADTVVNLGQAAGWVAGKIGDGISALAAHGPEN